MSPTKPRTRNTIILRHPVKIKIVPSAGKQICSKFRLIMNYSEVRKKSSKREREEGRTSAEGNNLLRKSSRTSRSEEENQSKEMDKEMKTMIREIREEMRGREEKG
jgi:hypothetical protein